MALIHLSASRFWTGFQLLSVVLLLNLLWLSPVDANNRRDEVRTLLSFKHVNSISAMGSSGIGYWNTWRESDPNPCAWVGVTCTAKHTVSELDLSWWGLNTFDLDGVEVLSNLQNLRRLDLSCNYIGGIPETIGNLSGLTVLDLSRNHIYGGIPKSLSACRDLRSLYLRENFLSQQLPSFHGMVNLQNLDLAQNVFSGSFPDVLGEVRSLVILDLSGNLFTGSIPALPKLTNLMDLKLDQNEFTAFEEPWFLGARNSLQHLSVSFNQLEGTIPASIPHLLNLQVLNMSGNRLTGGIPNGLSQRQKHSSFISVDLSQNELKGEIPPDILRQSNPVSCSSLNLSHNLLTGSIPPVVRGGRSCFFSLDLSYNDLSGPISAKTFGDAGDVVESLWLQHNRLSGDFVDAIALSPGLESTVDLRLQNNLFTGDLSRLVNIESYELYNLGVLNLSYNAIRWKTSEAIPDPIQATLQRLSTGSSGLTELLVAGNNFSGTSLPTSCFVNESSSSGSSLLVLDLSNSQLDGEISGAAFDVSCLPYLNFLSLSDNDITGSVPESILTHPSLTELDLSNNHLSGSLPSIPSNSSLLNPSYFEGNPGLCGSPLPACSARRPGVQWWVLLIIILGSVSIAAVFSSVVAVWQWKVYSKRHQQDADLIKTLLERDSATLMSLRDLRKATDNFAESAQIGEGGFGTVYMGKLSDGTVVAIKRSKREGSETNKAQFLNEVRILSHVNHRNLVKLMGCCMENKVAVLVFEYVSNGTLEQHLHGKLGAARLTWSERLNIAAQTADALNYLHSAATFPIYHRDVKSANILLDKDLNAKVADFGISKLAPIQATHVSTMAIHGTMGYIDPEYYTSYQLTDKSDVYSFGVVLLELISAKPPVDFLREGENTSLILFARSYIEIGELGQLIDPALMETYTDPTGRGRDSILDMGRLALKCVDLESKARPCMREVLKDLQSFCLERHGTSPALDVLSKGEYGEWRCNEVVLSKSLSSGSSCFTTDSGSSSARLGIQMSEFLGR